MYQCEAFLSPTQFHTLLLVDLKDCLKHKLQNIFFREGVLHLVKENNAGIEENKKKKLCTQTCLKIAVFLQKYSLISFLQTI